MSYISVDIEADGPIPGDFSMISFGAVIIDNKLNKTFFGKLNPISDKWVPEALAISGYTRTETLQFNDPFIVMNEFAEWIQENSIGSAIFIADNNGFDWMFICWYFHHFLKRNPFGFSSRNLNDIYHGLAKSMRSSFKFLRKTKHTHHPVDDAKGNAEAFLAMRDRYKLKVNIPEK